jgi:hypothetical protein
MSGQLDEAEVALVKSLIGRTIVAATWRDANPNHEWSNHEEALLQFDDGRIIRFGGWGYDAYGATVTEVSADSLEEK